MGVFPLKASIVSISFCETSGFVWIVSAAAPFKTVSRLLLIHYSWASPSIPILVVIVCKSHLAVSLIRHCQHDVSEVVPGSGRCPIKNGDVPASRVHVQEGIIPGIGVLVQRLRIYDSFRRQVDRVGTHEPTQARRIVPSAKVIKAAFAIAFFAGELAGGCVVRVADFHRTFIDLRSWFWSRQAHQLARDRAHTGRACRRSNRLDRHPVCLS